MPTVISFRVGEVGVELEEELILDQPVLIEHIGDGIDRKVLGNRDLDPLVLVAQSQDIRGREPQEGRQKQADAN